MARKKAQHVNQRKGNSFSSPVRVNKREGLLPTPSADDDEKIMDLSLPASPLTSRPGTPKEFAAGSTNCRELIKLAETIKMYFISIEGCQQGINDLL
ncbi:hypothetical protein TNIN_260931 [Trichonephila inaurata madagascariensis]|uniref:Uncharacterized protein n=1 Tax=Trichonephila inaurata madagascariensis TaxID=2747483 RepID=A0A8X6XWY6_9ARAC|nr:hypothetical protein TNIN_460461 [Trichonephila inaurata madagascariensis]GFY61811.1 hypothetical protein TNIN_260931 [Trichonephila inaurata madagascariensis]